MPPKKKAISTPKITVGCYVSAKPTLFNVRGALPKWSDCWDKKRNVFGKTLEFDSQTELWMIAWEDATTSRYPANVLVVEEKVCNTAFFT
jgi:hypothetical protein